MLEKARAELVAAVRRLRPDGLALGTAGNLSVRHGDLVAITPSAVPYELLTPEDVCVADLGGPVRVVPYATPGSAELAELIRDGLEGRWAVLLRNHGAVTVGPTLERAYARSVLLEWLAATYQRACQLGEPAVVASDDLERVARMLDPYFDAG